MPLPIREALGFTIALVLPIFPQTVSSRDGNIYVQRTDGQTVQITSSGLDANPDLSRDGQLVVFVRETPALKIATGFGDESHNELWIADTSGEEPARRVLLGHAGDSRQDVELILAGFANPQFSPDKTRIYFVAQNGGTTSLSINMLDLKSGQVRQLCSGLRIEVLQAGRFSGSLMVFKEIPLGLGRQFRYWLLHSEGKDVEYIGTEVGSVLQFKKERNGTTVIQ